MLSAPILIAWIMSVRYQGQEVISDEWRDDRAPFVIISLIILLREAFKKKCNICYTKGGSRSVFITLFKNSIQVFNPIS